MWILSGKNIFKQLILMIKLEVSVSVRTKFPAAPEYEATDVECFSVFVLRYVLIQ